MRDGSDPRPYRPFRSFQRVALELGTVSSVFLLCHETPPDALSRTFRSVHQTGAGPNSGLCGLNSGVRDTDTRPLQRCLHTIDYGLKDKATALVGFANDFRGS